ncbi:uncharacterized protein [Littorina saxatilis]|uniref:LicD/FKTN/FKRP nucleotidyltransferase domain-containing protein n=1 Tax=Littorina saxatilis TaxID=31220 RepID=A0AAN9G3X7_9CAEN
MGWSRPNGMRGSMLRQKVVAKVKVVAVVVVIVLMITPLRNMLMPSCLWHKSWNDLHTLKLIRIHLFDLFFYIDRTPYSGDCDHIRRQLEPLNKLKVSELPAYSQEDWKAGLEKVKWKFTPEELWKVEHFKPSLTPEEQREMLYTTLVLAQAFDIFNVSYFMAEGTLIGIHRHHGLIPWDDDVDLMIPARQWAKAKAVLSCIPDFSLSMGRDFMWKFLWNKSKLWRWETFIRFPYIDVFPHNEDNDHLWPLTIWMKRDVIWRAADTYPAQRLPMEGYYVTAPKNPAAILSWHYGPGIHEECASRIFKRREREPFPLSDRVRIPCSYLYDIYPFVFHTKDPADGTPVEVRKIGSKILSTFKPHLNTVKPPSQNHTP